MLTKRIFAFFTSLIVAHASSAWAFDPSLSSNYLRPSSQEDVMKFRRAAAHIYQSRMGATASQVTKNEILRRIEIGRKSTLAKPGVAIGHLSQTLVVLWILSGLQAAYQSYYFSPLQSKQTDYSDILRMTGDHLINSFDLFSGLAMGGAVTKLLKRPIESLQQVASSTTTRPMLKNLLVGGIGSFVTFVGFEAGSKLWEQATLLLDVTSEIDEVKIAQSLRFTEILSGGGTPEQRRVFMKLLKNAFEIMAFYQPEITTSWIYNTWRHRILTGEFMTLLMSMVTAGAAAGTLTLPGAGTFLGMCFGVVVSIGAGVAGGVAAMMLPHSFNQNITDRIREYRMWRSDKTLESLKELMRGELLDRFGYSFTHQTKIIEHRLQARRDARNDLMTVLFEQIYDSYLRYQTAETILNTIGNARATALAKFTNIDKFIASDGRIAIETESVDVKSIQSDYTDQLNEETARIKSFMNRLLNIQVNEANILGSFAYSELPNPQSKELLLSSLGEQSDLNQIFRNLYFGLLPFMRDELGLPQMSDSEVKEVRQGTFDLLSYFYFVGVNELDLLKQ